MSQVRAGPPSWHWLGHELPLPPLPEERRLAPIAVMSFNRPRYLEQVLVSLLAQSQDVRARRIVFYQDGAVSPLTGRRFAEDDDIAVCRALFRRLVPWGEERFAGDNLGVAGNFRRAEADMFGDPDNAIVYFLEDDLVLHPRYLDLMDRLALKTEGLDRPVGYFAAYGGLRSPRHVQWRERYRLQRLQHHWGFGLRRSHWLKMQPLLEPYYAMLAGRDYGDRDTSAILAHYARHGVPVRLSSQDDVKKSISYALGAVSICTAAAAGRYVGALGVHMVPELYAAKGFGKTRWLRRVEYDWTRPDAAELDRLHNAELAWRNRRQT